MAEKRMRMVDSQIRNRGVRDARVLQAMETVPRHEFVPKGSISQAYDDHPLHIGHGQTISQPYIVALMSEVLQLEPDDRVLEIVDKPQQTDLTEMWGCIIWRPRFTEYLHDCIRHQSISDFALIMNSAIGDGLRFRGVHMVNGLYIDLGTYEEIMELDRKYRGED